jgi:dihydropteroate synthase
MTGLAEYEDVVTEVSDELGQALARASSAGVAEDRIAIDPGIGFAKTTGQNLELLRRMEELAGIGYPLVLGPSRKRFLGEILSSDPDDRVEGTVAACLRGFEAGVRVFRVHDVAPVRRALDVAHAIQRGRP